MNAAAVFQGRRVLITGGAGFIGSTLAIRLAQAGAEVTVIDSLLPEYGGNLFNLEPVRSTVRVNVSDVRDRFSLQQLVAGQDYLFNLAGQNSHLDAMEDPFTDLDINCRAQISILEACRRVNPTVRVVFASTRQIYGRPLSLPVDESHPLQPVDLNGIHKLAGEAYHLLYARVYGLQACSLRLTNTIGPRMRIKDARQTFVGSWIRALLEDRPIEVWGGSQLRDLNDVEDVVEAFLLAAQSPATVGQAYNLGAKPPISLRDLAALMIELYGRGEYRVCDFPENRAKIDIGDYHGSFAALRSALGWSPRHQLRATLQRTLEYFGRHLAHYV